MDRVGGFDEHQGQHEDYDLWLRLALCCDVSALEEPLAQVRNHREHFSVTGIPALHAKRRLLDKFRARVDAPSLRAAIEAEQVRNTIRFAMAHAVLGDRTAVLHVLSGSWRSSWRHAAWWIGAARALLRLHAPTWLVTLYRSHKVPREPLPLDAPQRS
jgi:hypothetical protein